MEPSWKTVRDALVLAGSALFCAIVAGFFLLDDMRTASFWIGERNGWLPVLGGIGTVLAASAAAYFAALTYKATRREAVDTRFQKAAELLGSSNSITAIGGIYALRDIINVDPNRYYNSGLQLLCDFIGHRCQGDFLGYQSAEIRENAGAPNNYVIEPTSPEVALALQQFGRLRTAERVDEFETDARARFHIHTLVLHDQMLVGLNLSRLHIFRLIAGRATFRECNIREAQIIVAGVGSAHLIFEDCSLVETYLSAPRGPLAGKPVVQMAQCDLSSAALAIDRGQTSIIQSCVDRMGSDQLLGTTHCWHFGKPPVVASLKLNGCYDASGASPTKRSRRGLPIYSD